MTEEIERIVALEKDVMHLTERIASMDSKLTEIHSAFMQAKGARWFVVALASVGGFVAGKFGGFFAFK